MLRTKTWRNTPRMTMTLRLRNGWVSAWVGKGNVARRADAKGLLFREKDHRCKIIWRRGLHWVMKLMMMNR